MKRQSRYRRARQNRPRDQPLVHALAQKLAVFAHDLITEHAGSQQGPRPSGVYRVRLAEDRTAGGVHDVGACCRLVVVGSMGVGRGVFDLFLQEVQKGGVDHVGVSPGDVVGSAVDGDDGEVLDETGESLGGVGVGQDAVGVAVDEQDRHVDPGEVVAEVGQPAVDAGVGGVGGGGQSDIEAVVPRLVADPGAGQHVDVVGVVEKVLEVGGSVGDDRGLEVVEDGPLHTVGVVVGFEQERGNGAHQDGLADSRGAVGGKVAGHFAGAHGEPDQDALCEFEVLKDRVKVIGQGVVVVADAGSTGVAKAAAVVGDDAVSGVQQDAFLLFPGVPVQWVSVDQDNRLPGAVILVVEVDVVGVFFSDGDDGHGGPFPPRECQRFTWRAVSCSAESSLLGLSQQTPVTARAVTAVCWDKAHPPLLVQGHPRRRTS
jgi:hypothetical protein